MALDQLLLDLCPHTVTYAPLTSRDGYGNPAPGAATSYPARVEKKVKQVRDRHGTEKNTTTLVYILTSDDLVADGQFTLPDGSTPEVTTIETFIDEDGAIHHYKVRF